MDIYKLKNSKGMEITVSNYGGRVLSLLVPDRDGVFDDVVLGFESPEEYRENPDTYFGATIGRYANRIAKGKFSLGGKDYQLEQNNESNALHGGPGGFHNVMWDVLEADSSRIVMEYISPDGEEGYPGRLKVKMTYTLTEDNEFRIDYLANTDQKTIINLTHHSFFNLSGAGHRDVMDHVLQLNAENYIPVDEQQIPTGEIRPVKDSPMDFTSSQAIGSKVDSMDEQLSYGRGYDHTWVLDKNEGELALAAVVFAPSTKRKLEVLTDAPGIQFYSGNYLDGSVNGKGGKTYGYRCAFCLESQDFPDAPNQPNFPSAELNPGETYSHTCIYRFSVDEDG